MFIHWMGSVWAPSVLGLVTGSVNAFCNRKRGGGGGDNGSKNKETKKIKKPSKPKQFMLKTALVVRGS